jgi:hypothetical protein
MPRFVFVAIMLAILSANAQADDLVVYGAGSLRESIGHDSQNQMSRTIDLGQHGSLDLLRALPNSEAGFDR